MKGLLYPGVGEAPEVKSNPIWDKLDICGMTKTAERLTCVIVNTRPFSYDLLYRKKLVIKVPLKGAVPQHQIKVFLGCASGDDQCVPGGAIPGFFKRGVDTGDKNAGRLNIP